MGSCMSKKSHLHHQQPDSNGVRSITTGGSGGGGGGGGTGGSDYQSVPQVIYDKPPIYDTEVNPKASIPVQSAAPAVQKNQYAPRADINNILGKQFEDIKAKYTLGKELGRGRFGVTYNCVENSTGLTYACKSILKRKLISKNDKEDIKKEIHIMHHLSGLPNIVEFKDYC